jgi:hypothetical protein
MRLLVAELRKLNRPLLWWVIASSALFCVLLAAGGSSNAGMDVRGAETSGPPRSSTRWRPAPRPPA